MRAGIASEVLDAILAAAAADPHREVCGLLFGSRERIVAAAAAANVAAAPHDSFEIDPGALFAALRAERAGGPRMIGHYHSHPTGRPEPSPRDAAAAEPGRLWLIVGDGAARLWWSQPAGRFAPVALEIGGTSVASAAPSGHKDAILTRP
jgi:proteasome lid subunit RPN8/RPN11